MSDYIRRLSYFYRYQNGGKQENVGFCKVECRQGRLKVTLNLSDNKVVGSVSHSIFLYRYSSGKMQLLAIGESVFENGRLIYHKESDEKIPLNEYSGIIAYHNEQLFFGSQWDDEPIRLVEIVRCMKENEQNDNKDINSNNNRIKTPLYETENEMEEYGRQEQNIRSDEGVKENGDIRQTDGETKTLRQIQEELNEKLQRIAGKGREEENIFQTDKRENVFSQQLNVDKGFNNGKGRQENNKSREITGADFLMMNRSKLPGFQNNEVVDCVRIVPEDIGILERENWDYGNNSFVLHGFYNYSHLMFGKIKYNDNKYQYIIGVPGIFSNKDKYLAGIFGFHEFITLKECEHMTGEFGYWIAKIR